MKPFLESLGERVLLFDGGMGSMLIAAGLGEGEAPDVWNITRPDVLMGVHKAFLDAGADVIQTNTFGATPVKLAASSRGAPPDAAKVNEAGATLARTAIREFGFGDRWLAGDIGPTGEFFPPMGVLTEARAFEAFRIQAEALENGVVDIFLIETMYDIREAVAAVRAVREVSVKPVVCELTMERKKRGYFTIVGDTPARAAEELPAAGADMIGANCSMASAEMIDLASEMRALTKTPLLFQPNAGRPEMVSGKAVYRQTPEEFAAEVMKIVEAGAEAVGGCCGTTPEFIRALRAKLDAWR
ncbi:MAG: homocysteine S-methyltransferase family protein [Candidatus Krumholzibacteria bacterium]|nr:homocysteine S-methyltransferase family protein [Candidatus Krumholzibacteria bacterium]